MKARHIQNAEVPSRPRETAGSVLLLLAILRMNYLAAEQWVSIGISIIASRGGELINIKLIKPLSAVFMAGLSGGLNYLTIKA